MVVCFHLVRSFKDLFEDNKDATAWITGKLLGEGSEADDVIYGMQKFINIIMGGINGVFDIFSMCITFFFHVPVLSLLLSFGFAFAGIRLLKFAIGASDI